VFLPQWSYTLSDPGLRVFTLANPLLPSIPDGGSVLEIGCCDTDFLKMVREANPTLTVTGIDQRKFNRPDHTGVILGDVLAYDFPPESFDAVCSLSAIEHIGLGRYQDPIDPDGDTKAINRVREWLKPGGWCYFDVPYTPEGYCLFDTNKCRCYDDQSLTDRFGPHDVLGVADSKNTVFLDPKPTTNHSTIRPWWYIALLVRKDAAH
jgi:SAM-dependent methyltransferase